jgi:hypothetical protein
VLARTQSTAWHGSRIRYAVWSILHLKAAAMDSANWLTVIGQSGRLFVQSLPDAFWLAYYWAKDWQILLGGLFVLIAAQIFVRGSLRSARIQAAAAVRAAQITAGVVRDERLAAAASSESAARQPTVSISAEPDLLRKIEQLRSLIRSAMAMLASDADGADASSNIYCERIARLRFDEKDLPLNPSANVLELYKRFLLQLAAIRRVTERRLGQKESQEALVQLNARARELAAAVAPTMTTISMYPARQPNQARG